MLRGRVKDMFKSYRSPDNAEKKTPPPPPREGAASTPPLSASPPLQQTRQQSMQQQQQQQQQQQLNYDTQDEQVRLATEMAMAARQNPHLTPEELRRNQQQQQPDLLGDAVFTSTPISTATQVPQQPPSSANRMTTSVTDDFFTKSTPQQQQQQQQHEHDDDDDDEDYVPESLASFVKQANSMLEQTQQTFWQEMEKDAANADVAATGSWEDQEDPTSPRQVEDDHDRQIKGDLLDRLDRRRRHNKEAAAAAPMLGGPDAPIPVMEEEEDKQQPLARTPVMPQQQIHASNNNNNNQIDDTFLWSPDLLISPPPNPVQNMTESQIKREAVGGKMLMDYSTPPPSYEAAMRNAVVAQQQQQQQQREEEEEAVSTTMDVAAAAAVVPPQPLETTNMDLEFAVPPARDQEQQQQQKVDLMQLDETAEPQLAIQEEEQQQPQPGADLLNLLSEQPEMEYHFEQEEPDLIAETKIETNEEEEEVDLFHLHDEPTPQSAAVADSELLHLESPSQEPEMNFVNFSPSSAPVTTDAVPFKDLDETVAAAKALPKTKQAAIMATTPPAASAFATKNTGSPQMTQPVEGSTVIRSQTPQSQPGSASQTASRQIPEAIGPISKTMPASSSVKTSKTPGSAARTATDSSSSSSSQVKMTPASTARSRLASADQMTPSGASSRNKARSTSASRTTPASTSSSTRAKATPTSSKKAPGSATRKTPNPGSRTTPSSAGSNRVKQTPVSRTTPPSRTTPASASRSVASSTDSDLYSRLSRGTAASRAHSVRRPSPKASTASPARASPASTTHRRSPAVASRSMEETAASQSHTTNITKVDTGVSVSSKPNAVVPAPMPGKSPSPTNRLLQGTAASRAHAAQHPSGSRPSPIVTTSPSMSSTSRLMQDTVASRAHATPEPGPRTSPGGVDIPSVSPTSRLMQDTAASRAHMSPQPVPSPTSKSIPAVPEGSHLMQETESSKAHAVPRSSPAEAQKLAASANEIAPMAPNTHEDPSPTGASPDIASDMTSPSPSAVPAESSRLMHGTAASQAKKQDDAVQTGTSRLLRGTSTSQSRASGSRRLAQGTAASGSRVVSEGSAKAQERVRQRMLQEKHKKQQQQQQQPPGTTTQRAPRLTTDERVARARERVRQKELEQKAAIGRKIKKGKPLTVPKAPNLATSAKYGERLHVGRNEPTLAQSTDVLRRGLRDERTAPPMKTGPTKPTIPHSPRFATTARCGEKTSVPGPSKGYSISSAQSTDVLRQQLRQPIKTSRKREPGLTIPKTPKFHASAKRELPKSTAEKEKEMMEYFQSHPFKARPINTQPGGTQVVRKPAKRRLTMPTPFNLRTDVRGANAKPIAATPDPEERDLEETKKQFHARPMPTFSHPSKVQAAPARKSLSVTQPEPFHFASERLARSARRAHENPDDVELAKQFRARPPPKTTYEYHGPMLLKSPTSSLSSDLSAHRAPSLQTSARSEQRRESVEAAKRRAEQFAQQKKLDLRQRIRDRHYEAMRQAELASPVSAASKNASPFSLQSAARHEAYQQKLEEKLREEEARRRKEMEFHARSFRSTPAPAEKIHSNRGPTQPEPFALPGMRRHEMSQEEQKRKLAEMEEERRRISGFKARPVPKSTYKYKPISPHGTGELVQPFSPEFQSKQRAVERQAFDERVERERQEEEARQRAIRERLAAEEAADLHERRRLPVSEGGMIPLAEPVNAILASEHQRGIYQK